MTYYDKTINVNLKENYLGTINFVASNKKAELECSGVLDVITISFFKKLSFSCLREESYNE